MNEFTASNGWQISDNGLYTSTGKILIMAREKDSWNAMKEYFSAERDEELGIWRDEDYPGMFAAPTANPDVVQVVKELGGVAYEQFDRGDGRLLGPMSGLAHAYFDAHPPVPKNKPLPTEPGVYVTRNTANATSISVIIKLRGLTGWEIVSSRDEHMDSDLTQIQHWHNVLGLVRLVPESDNN